jgi:trans-aconitate methyltransferase
VLELLAKAIRLEKDTKVIQIGKEEIKLFLFSDDTFLYLKDHKDSNKMLLDLINTLSKINVQKPAAFAYTNNRLRKKLGKQFPSAISSKMLNQEKKPIKHMNDIYKSTMRTINIEERN